MRISEKKNFAYKNRFLDFILKMRFMIFKDVDFLFIKLNGGEILLIIFNST